MKRSPAHERLQVVIPAWLLAIAALCIASGCIRPADQPPSKSGQPAEPRVHLRLMVVDDPALATAIDQMKGEWGAQTGSTFEVARTGRIDLSAADPPEADAVITSSAQMAELAARSWLLPVPSTIIEDRSQDNTHGARGAREGGWAEIFPLVRARETIWGNAAMAVPFGSPVFVLYCRADLLEKLGAKPPKTWTEYQKLAALLEDRKRLGEFAPPAGAPWLGTMEPLTPGWASAMLLARAAPYATHRANYSALFQLDTMEPLIDGPPFVRALEEQTATLAKTAQEHLRADPAQVRRAFWSGRCGMAVTWPSATHRQSGLTPTEKTADSQAVAPETKREGREIRLIVAELPGSAEVYNIAPQAWEPRRGDEDPRVPLLAIAGRMGMVTSRCVAPDMAFRLLAWLSGQPSSRAAATLSPATTLFRQSDLRFPQAWTESEIPPAVAAQYALLTQQTLSREQAMFALRIPGRGEYLAALDEAVQQAVRGQQKPLDALRQVKIRWQEITSRLGLDRQREAYRHSLGL